MRGAVKELLGAPCLGSGFRVAFPACLVCGSPARTHLVDHHMACTGEISRAQSCAQINPQQLVLLKNLDCQRPVTDIRHICLASDRLPPGAGEFYKKNKRLPEVLVMYRDGVSEGQVPPSTQMNHRTCVSPPLKCSTDACQGSMLVVCRDGVSEGPGAAFHLKILVYWCLLPAMR